MYRKQIAGESKICPPCAEPDESERIRIAYDLKGSGLLRQKGEKMERDIGSDRAD